MARGDRAGLDAAHIRQFAALRREPSAGQSAIRIAADLSADEIAGSAVARNILILLRQAIERGGLPLTATGNLSRAAVADMCKLIEWPLCVPKIRFGNIGGEAHREPAVK